MEDLISKKELLEQTGISYGALYRYKRKNLIPNEWFIRKSTFTGQETFFPRELVLRRIEQIQALKEEVSLDGMQDVLSADVPRNLRLAPHEVLPHLLPSLAEKAETFLVEEFLRFQQILALTTADAALKSGKVALNEGELILQTVLDFRAPVEGDRLIGCRRQGVFFCLILNGEVWMNADTTVVVEINLAERVSALKVLVRDKARELDE